VQLANKVSLHEKAGQGVFLFAGFFFIVSHCLLVWILERQLGGADLVLRTV
jgi:hypothetical protein